MDNVFASVAAMAVKVCTRREVPSSLLHILKSNEKHRIRAHIDGHINTSSGMMLEVYLEGGGLQILSQSRLERTRVF